MIARRLSEIGGKALGGGGTAVVDRLRKATRVLEEAEESHSATPRHGLPSIPRESVIAMLEPDKGKLRELVHEGRLAVSGRAGRFGSRSTRPRSETVTSMMRR